MAPMAGQKGATQGSKLPTSISQKNSSTPSGVYANRIGQVPPQGTRKAPFGTSNRNSMASDPSEVSLSYLKERGDSKGKFSNSSGKLASQTTGNWKDRQDRMELYKLQKYFT